MRIKLLLLAVLLFSVSYINAEGGKQGNANSPANTNGSPTKTFLDINKICTTFYNDGRSDISNSGTSAFVYPAGSGKATVFESGFLWGAYVSGDTQVRVGGSAYGTGLQGGKITNSGALWNSLIAESPTADNVRIYRVRADIYPGSPAVDLSTDATLEGTDAATLQAQYLKDYNEWPYDKGAPYYFDNNNNKIPGIKGADQTIWFVANDLNQKLTTGLYGANPMGIEYQATCWAYNQSGALGNMIFRKYKLINKTNIAFNNMYVSMWSDPDVGDAADDFAGCDTTLSLGFAYNANTVDATYSPLPPPAVGFDLFQGPKVAGVAGQDLNKNGIDDAVDYAMFDGKKVGPGLINLPMTAFYYFANGDATVTDPTIGAIDGSNQMYNFFQGKVGKTGKYFIDPTTGKNTTFVLPGDPQKNSGWIDGIAITAGDRRIGLASGPFTMAAGDTQEVVVAEIAAGATPGVDRLSAIGLLKYYDTEAQKAYDNSFVVIVDTSLAPPVPVVTSYGLDKEIVLKWNTKAAEEFGTEYFNKSGNMFQGYNVYQLPSAGSSIAEAKLLASFDLHDGIKNVPGRYFDSTSHSYVTSPFNFGSDLGVQRFYDVRSDALNSGLPLTNATNYYFAVTSYSYSPTTASAAESAIKIITVVPAVSGISMDSPLAPSAPVVIATAMNKEVIVNWDSDVNAINTTEALNKNGYKFQGYNVYQLPTATSPSSDGVLVGSFDIIDGYSNLSTQYYSLANNTYYPAPFKFGSDNGIQRYLDIKTDALNNTELTNGVTYYFGVAAFSYNPTAFAINGMESALKTVAVTPQVIPTDTSSFPLSGKVFTNITHAAGSGIATCYYVVSDPTKLKGANYTLGFSTQPDLLVASGSGNNGASASATFILSEDGTKLDYSIEVTDVNLSGAITSSGIGYGIGNISKNIALTTSTVLNHVVGSASGTWRNSDATETFTSVLKDALVGQNLEYILTGADSLEAPIIISSYPWYLDRGTTRVLSYQHNYSLDNSYLTVDGIQPKIGELTFSTPVTFNKSGTKLTKTGSPASATPLQYFDNEAYFGVPTTLVSENFGGGASCTREDYIQDIELRFTGTAANHDSICTAGGQWATIRSRSSAAAQRRIRIPFEVWEVERNRQINVVLTDRNADGAAPWGNSGQPQWFRMKSRDYMMFIATPYSGDTINWSPILRTDAHATWWFSLDETTDWATGDVFHIAYDNPIIPGVDTYTFKTPGSILSAENANAKAYSFALGQNYPNPFNPATKISYSIPKAGHVSMKIFDVLGREVLTLVNTEMKAGDYSVDFNASHFASGVYFYKLQAGDKSIVKKMMLLK